MGAVGALPYHSPIHPSCYEEHHWESELGELPLATGRHLPTQTSANARLTWGTEGQFPYLKAELTLM